MTNVIVLLIVSSSLRFIFTKKCKTNSNQKEQSEARKTEKKIATTNQAQKGKKTD